LVRRDEPGLGVSPVPGWFVAGRRCRRRFV